MACNTMARGVQAHIEDEGIMAIRRIVWCIVHCESDTVMTQLSSLSWARGTFQ
jgi:hypothetical protein